MAATKKTTKKATKTTTASKKSSYKDGYKSIHDAPLFVKGSFYDARKKG